MLNHVKWLIFLCLLGGFSSASSEGTEEFSARRNFIMGGAGDNLRAISKMDADTTFNVYLIELYKKFGLDWTIKVDIYPDTHAVLAEFDKGKIDGYFGTPLDYLARKDKLCKTMVAMRYRLAPLQQPFFLVVRVGDGVTNLGDLKNKRLSMGLYQDMEALFLNTLLLRNQLPEIPQFFNERRPVKNINNALMDVFFNRSDVVVVRENEFNVAVELNPQLGKQLVVLDQSPPMLAMLGMMSNKMLDQQFSWFLDDFNRVIKTDKGKKLMSLVQVEDFTEVSYKDIKSVEDLLSEYDALKEASAETHKKMVAPSKIKIKRNEK